MQSHKDMIKGMSNGLALKRYFCNSHLEERAVSHPIPVITMTFRIMGQNPASPPRSQHAINQRQIRSAFLIPSVIF